MKSFKEVAVSTYCAILDPYVFFDPTGLSGGTDDRTGDWTTGLGTTGRTRVGVFLFCGVF